MAHSSIIGGSTAARLLACPGSFRAISTMPETAAVESVYAAEGTHAHEVMRQRMEWRQEHERRGVVLRLEDALADTEATIGTNYNFREFTYEQYATMIEPALRQLTNLEFEYGGAFKIVGIEQSVRFPGVPGAFGTVDLILQSTHHVLLVDWKFGQGVGVRAVYGDDTGAVVNPQLMFYATAAYATMRKQFVERKIVVAIIQPRGDEPLTHTLVTRKELAMFAEDVHVAVVAALEREPPINKGEHCRFAPCKVTCPLWTGPLLDLSTLQPPPPPPAQPTAKITPYGRYLAQAKALADAMAIFKATLDEQLHAYLQAGGAVPGWRLKQKTKQRQWAKTDLVAKTLRKLGFEQDDIWQQKLQTFAVADAAARRLGVVIPDHLRVAPQTSETTVARVDDPAPVVEPAVQAQEFATALKELRRGPLWLSAGKVMSADR